MNKRLFPVLHVKNDEQVLRNLAGLEQCDIDGVFLIHHTKPTKTLLKVVKLVRAAYPDLWLGINMLDKDAIEARISCPQHVQGLWVDDMGVYEEGDIFSTMRARVVAQLQTASKPEYFGSFAFKYQSPVKSLTSGALIASRFADVLVTSGDGTGIAADVKKIQDLRAGCNTRLGIASGVTLENVGDYLPYVDDYLVATGVSTDFHNFDFHKVRELAKTIHAVG